jgi:hypothetical protein
MAVWYVNAGVGSSGTGKSPSTAFRTLGEAVLAASGGDTVNVAGGIYRETVRPAPASGPSPLARTRILGDPDDPFVISGGQRIDGMVRCTAADSSVVGANWSKVFKGTIVTAAFPGGNPFAGNLCEDGVQLPICNERADRSDTFFLSKPSYYHTADSVVLSGVNITGFRKPSVTDLYTKAQIDRSRAYFVREPNVAGEASVIFDEVTKTIQLQDGPHIYENSIYKDDFALFNLLPAIRQGEWGFVSSGGVTTVYVWPRDEARIATGISYSVRTTGLDLNGSNHVEIAYFEVRQTAASSTSQGPVISGGGRDIYLHHFEVADTLGTGSAYAAIYMSSVDDLHMHDFNIFRAQGTYGVFLQGAGAGNADWPALGYGTRTVDVPDGATLVGQTSGATVRILFQHNKTRTVDIGWYCYEPEDITGTFINGENIRYNGSTVSTVLIAESKSTLGDAGAVNQSLRGNIHDFVIDTVSESPLRMYTQKDLAIYRGTVRNAAKQSHGNTLNFYQGCHNCLVWGLNGEGSDGYYTWQESDSIVLAFVAGSASSSPSGGARAIQQQQNRFSELPGVAHGFLGSYILNTRGVPLPERALDARYGNGLEITSSVNAPLNKFKVYNNIHHGSSTEAGGVALLDWDHNINTKGSGAGTGTRGSNDTVVDAAALYTDPANGDFSYPDGSAVRTFAARDWSDLIPGFRARWPQIPAEVFTRDMAGEIIDWSVPPVGPTVDSDVDYLTAWKVVTLPPREPALVAPKLRSRFLRLSVTVAGS